MPPKVRGLDEEHETPYERRRRERAVLPDEAQMQIYTELISCEVTARAREDEEALKEALNGG